MMRRFMDAPPTQWEVEQELRRETQIVARADAQADAELMDCAPESLLCRCIECGVTSDTRLCASCWAFDKL